ncbi:MAG: tail tape measure protein core region [Nitrospirae bacterium]|nr:MAG: tail tape measure protein core region [Nitrospirota bacterium]
MSNILELILRGRADQLDSVIRSSGKNIETFGRKSIAAFQRVGSTINTLSDRYLNRFTSVLGGASLLYAGKGVIDLDARLARLAITAGGGAKMLVGMKKELFEISAITYTPVGELVTYIKTIVARTGDIKFAMATIKDVGLASAATETSMADMGEVVANLKEKLKLKPEEILPALDILNLGAKAGAVEFSDFAKQMVVMASSTGRFNLEGLKGVRIISAWAQMAFKSNSSSDEMATSIKDAVSEMLTLEKIKKMQKLGFNPIDTVASKKAGVTVMKDIEDVIKGIVKATKGDEIKLGQIFGLRSITAFSDMAREFRATGKFDTFDKFAQQGGDSVETMKDFHFWTKQTAAQITNIKTGLSKLTNENLDWPIKKLNAALTFLNNHPIITKGGLGTILGIGAVAVAFKGIFGLIDIWGRLSGKGSKGIPGIGGLGLPGAGKGPIPVYIVNKHLSMLPGGYQFPGGDIPGGGIPGGGKFGKLAGIAGKASMVAGVGIAGYQAGTLINKGMGKLTGKGEGWLGEMLYDLLHPSESSKGKQPEIKNNNEINLTLSVDQSGKVISNTNDMNTKINLKRTGF